MNNDYPDNYKTINQQIQSIIADEYDWVANLANISAILFENLSDINWAGFYLFKDEQLVLGPFQGKVACIRIELNKGVCGTAASQQQTLVVEDVHQFDGHIACDAASNSEIVVPIIIAGKLVGVLDIDSPLLGRFSKVDKLGLESTVKMLSEHYQDHPMFVESICGATSRGTASSNHASSNPTVNDSAETK